VSNRFQPKVKGKIIPQNITMYLDDSTDAFHGWENLTVGENINTIANAFSFDIPQVFFQTNSPFKLTAGVKVSIFLNKQRVITGFIDRPAVSLGPSTRKVNISGRSLSSDLVDCSVEGKMEYKNILIDSLARKLLAPFPGLKVFLSVEAKSIAKFAIRPGDSVFEALDRAARLQGAFWIGTREGNIRLTQGATSEARFRSVSRLEENINMKTGSVIIDDSQRYSKYTVKGQTTGTDNYPGVISSVGEGVAFDRGILRNRPLVIIAEGNADTEICKQRAQWEAATRTAKSVKINIVTKDWTQEDGTIWGVNQLVPVISASLGLDGSFLTTNIERVRSNSEGTITRIALTRQDAYNPKPEIKDDGANFKSLEGIVNFSQRNTA